MHVTHACILVRGVHLKLSWCVSMLLEGAMDLPLLHSEWPYIKRMGYVERPVGKGAQFLQV